MRSLYYIIGIIAILSFYCIVFVNCINIPYWDDYDNFLQPTILWNSNITLHEKLAVFFDYNNDHCLLFARTMAYVSMQILGNVNFAFIIIIGSTLFFAMALVLALSTHKYTHRTYFIILAGILLFNLSYDRAIIWPSVQFTIYIHVLISILSLRLLLSKSQWCILAAYLTSFFAISSGGVGIVLVPTGLFLIIIGENKRKLIIWFGYIILLFAASWCIRDHEQITLPSLSSLLPFLRYYIGLCGNIFFNSELICVLIGLILVTAFITIVISRIYKSNIILTAIIGYLFLLLLAIAIARFDTSDQMLAPRYKYFSTILFVSIFLLLAERYHQQMYKYCSILLFSAIFCCGITYYNSTFFIIAHKYALVKSICTWEQTGFQYYSNNVERFTSILNAAVENGSYVPPDIDCRTLLEQ